MAERASSRLASIAILLAVVSIGAAAGEAGPQRGQFFISGLGAYYDLSDDLGFDDGEVGPGLGIGYVFHDQWAAEINYFRFEGEFETPLLSDDADVDAVWANVLWLIPVQSQWQPYTTIGAGRTSYDFGSLGDEDETELNFGLGAFVDLSPRISFRGDVRGVYLTDAEDLTPFVSLGVSVALGHIAPAVQADADGDGVPDGSDACPNTPAGRAVDVVGCELDGDEDGVVDGADACPNTPPGAPVDSRGCALDSDADGVPDYLDECPGSEAGAKVDQRGCYVLLEETVTVDLNVEFETDSDVLREAYGSEIDRVATFLRQYPVSGVVIEGHTDNTGAAAYNQGLSERRARSVMDELVARGIDPNRLSSVGYGEDRPVASNDTREGRQRNRRVTAVVSGRRTERVQRSMEET